MKASEKNITFPLHFKKTDEPKCKCKNLLVNIENVVKNKKIPCIPPLFYENKYVADFKSKAELFNCFSTKQCFIINNSSDRPFNFCKKTDKSNSAITFNNDDIAALFKSLDPNIANGHGMISICMLYLYYPLVERSLNV